MNRPNAGDTKIGQNRVLALQGERYGHTGGTDEGGNVQVAEGGVEPYAGHFFGACVAPAASCGGEEKLLRN